MFVFCLGVKNFWFISAKMDDFQMICRRLIVGLILLGLELTCSTIFWDLSTLSRLFLYFKTYNLGRFNPFTAPRLLLFTFLFLIMFLILIFFFLFLCFLFFLLFLFFSSSFSHSVSLSLAMFELGLGWAWQRNLVLGINIHFLFYLSHWIGLAVVDLEPWARNILPCSN